MPENDDIISVLATISLTLPRELVERILLLLDAKYILACKLINREFNEIIQSSTLLQYFLACKAAGVIDNPRSPLSYGERLEALLKREETWRTLKPVFETTVKVNHRQYTTYGLTAGVFFLDDNNRKDLHYCHLPSSPQDQPRWNRIQVYSPEESAPGILSGFDTAIYEYDLIINVISSNIGNQENTQRYSLDLVLLTFSTGEYHPLARHHRIHVQRLPEDRPRVRLRIVGDNFALTVQSRFGNFPDRLFVFNWKTGYKRLQHETTRNAYSDLVFVSPEILLVFKLVPSHFEVWHLPPSHHSNPKPPVQILVLQIPAVSRDYSLGDITCCGQPTLSLHPLPYFPPRPFLSSPENSIISANLFLNSRKEIGSFLSYTLIIPRRALLDTIQKWTSPSLREQLKDLPLWFTNEVNVHEIADADDGSVRLDAQSKSVGAPTPHISADTGSSPISSGASTTLSTAQYNIFQVHWADWGPPISRWLQVSESLWIMGSIGQRYAFLGPKPGDRSKLIINVADFNQNNMWRNMDTTARLRRGEGKNRGCNDNNENGKEQFEEELEMLEHEGVFSEDVYMGLKCVVYHAPDEYDFDAVLMDEERLLGLKLNHGDVKSVKVLYFG